MRTFRVSGALAVVLAFAGMAWVYARDQKSHVFGPQDYAELQHLTSRLNQGADSHDADLWVSLWTPDGVWTNQEGRSHVGHAGLREYRRARRAELDGRTDIRHWTNSLSITPTAEGATGRSYYMMMRISTNPPTPVSAGHYDDVYVKTSNGWRIKSRTIRGYPADSAIAVAQ
jgi:hypothetical protein